MGSLSIWHWMIVGAVVLLLFGGRGKISDMMGDVAKGIKSFKKGMADDDTADAAKSDAPMQTIDHQAAGRHQAARRGREQSLALAVLTPSRRSRPPMARLIRRLERRRSARMTRPGNFSCSTSAGPNSC